MELPASATPARAFLALIIEGHVGLQGFIMQNCEGHPSSAKYKHSWHLQVRNLRKEKGKENVTETVPLQLAFEKE